MNKEKLIFRLQLLGWTPVALLCLAILVVLVTIALVIVFMKHIFTGESTFPFGRDIPWILSIRKKLARINQETALQGTP